MCREELPDGLACLELDGGLRSVCSEDTVYHLFRCVLLPPLRGAYQRCHSARLSASAQQVSKVSGQRVTRAWGGYASLQGIQQNATNVVQNKSISTLCMLAEDHEARSNCSAGAAKQFILNYHSDTQARMLCDFFGVDVRDACLQAAEEFYTRFQE